MKYIIPAVLLILGLTVGYILGKNSNQSKDIAIQTVNHPSSPKIEIVHDTIVKQEILEVKTSEKLDTMIIDTSAIDSTLNQPLDTAKEVYITKNDTLKQDTIINDDISINSDKKLSSLVLNIIYLDEQKTSKSDSLINEMINAQPTKNKTIILEFWESPLNYSGYKMSKTKIIAFGLNPQFDYKLYVKNKQYFLNFEHIYYQLQETTTYLKYISVDKSTIFND